MSTLPYDDANARRSEQVAQRWVDQYVGRRRIDDKTMALLVQACKAELLGRDATPAYDRALQRLTGRGLSLDEAVALADRARRTAAHQEARAQIVAELEAIPTLDTTADGAL